MLVIRKEQFKSFELYLLDQFIDECAAYVRDWWPHAAANYPGPAELRAFTAKSIKKSKAAGFRDRAQLRRLLDWECEFGDGFYEEPKWEWLKNILQSDLAPASRIHRIENRMKLLRERGDL